MRRSFATDSLKRPDMDNLQEQIRSVGAPSEPGVFATFLHRGDDVEALAASGIAVTNVSIVVREEEFC